METLNIWGQLIEAEQELEQAERAVRSMELTPRVNTATKAYIYTQVRDARAKVAALTAECEAENERIEAAILERQGADAVETAERILGAARTVSDRNALLERTVRVWRYDAGSEYPDVWDGSTATVADVAHELGELGEHVRPTVRRTHDGHVAFCWAGGRRVVIKGATADELRQAWRAGVLIVATAA